MEITSIRHKALRSFVETGRTKGLPGNLIDRLRKMVIYLGFLAGPDEFAIPPNYGAHLLTGDRGGTWSLTVSGNWRMTFWIDEAGAIHDVDLEDYH